VGPGFGFVLPFPGEYPGVFAFALAYSVEGIFDGFPVQDAVAVVDALPRADSAQLCRSDRGLDTRLSSCSR
jgi:hypothetical protein